MGNNRLLKEILRNLLWFVVSYIVGFATIYAVTTLLMNTEPQEDTIVIDLGVNIN